MISRKGKLFIFVLTFVCFAFYTSTMAQAVIPQLIGPLTALVSIIPQILLFVGVAVLAIFRPMTYRMLISRIHEFASQHKAIASLLAIVVVGGLAGLTYRALQPPHPSVKATTDVRPTVQSTVPKRSQHSWSGFRGGITRTGHLDHLPGPTTAGAAWIFKETGDVVDFSSSPAVVGDRVYIGSAQASIFSSAGAVYCFDANSGDVLWQYSSPTQIFSSPTVVGGRVYVGEGLHYDIDCHLRCLDATDGKEIWSFPTASHIESSPFVSQGMVYFGAGEDGVYCVDALEGKEIWHYPSIHVDTSPVVWKGIAYFGAGYGEHRIYAVDANDGKEIWSKPVDYPAWGSPSANGDVIYFGLGNGDFIQSADEPKGRVIAVNANTGEGMWAYEAMDAVLTAVSYRDGFVYFGSRDGHIYALNAANGELRWKLSIGNPIVSSPAVTADAVYFGANNGGIFCLDITNGDVKWWFNTDKIARGLQIYSSPAVANGKLYVGSNNRYLFCLGDREGQGDDETGRKGESQSPLRSP